MARLGGLVFVLALVLVAAPRARASNDPLMDAQLARIGETWAHIKYQVGDHAEQLREIRALKGQADVAAARWPGRPEPLIWQGIAHGQAAELDGGLGGLGDARAARTAFEAAYKLDRTAMDASPPTLLGALYYMVPGFPVAFGDKAKARRYLAEAVSLAPDSLDAEYFYGDFLAKQGEDAAAAQALRKALATPPHPDRPVWDAGRRAQARAALAKVEARLKSGG